MSDRTAGQNEAGIEAAKKALLEHWEPIPIPPDDRDPAIAREYAEVAVAAYLATVSPVGVEGEDEREQVRKDLKAIVYAATAFAKTGEADLWDDVRRIAEQSLITLAAASPSSPTGEER